MTYIWKKEKLSNPIWNEWYKETTRN